MSSVEKIDDKETIMKMLKKSYKAVYLSERLLNDKDIAIRVGSQHGSSILIFPYEIRSNRDVMMAAVKHWPAMVFHYFDIVDNIKKDRNLLIEAIKRLPTTQYWGSIDLTYSEVISLLTYKAEIYRLLPKKFRLREFALIAVKKWGMVLEDVEFNDDLEIVEAAVKQNPFAIKFASSDLRANHHTLRFASSRLRCNTEFQWIRRYNKPIRSMSTDILFNFC